jgi:hypothetical protein
MNPPEDAFEQRLRLIGKVTRLFKEQGWDLIVVGGSALEFYTEGQYASGDIDVCRRLGQQPIPPAIERDVMRGVGATSTGTRRQWKIGEVFLDLLGEIETARDPVFRTLQTPEGPIQLMPAEDVLVERVFVAQSQTPADPATKAAARKMAAAAIAMGPDFDWDKAFAIARSREYGIEQSLRDLVGEVRPPAPRARSGDEGKA